MVGWGEAEGVDRRSTTTVLLCTSYERYEPFQTPSAHYRSFCLSAERWLGTVKLLSC